MNPMDADLDHILGHTAGLWEELRGRRVFLTGGTGFFGIWMLESLLRAIESRELGASVTVLTRDPEAFRARMPRLAAHPAIALHAGDIRDFAFPEGPFSHIVHMASTSAQATFQGEEPLAKFDTIAGGTRRALDFAARCGARRFLYTSSGAVYGPQPPGMSRIPEEYPGAPDPRLPASALGEAKRVAEFLCADCARRHPIGIAIARCFSFLGPHLQMDLHYAAGNFLKDAARGGPIEVRGDGTAIRSYLYAADAAIWLWTLLLRGESGGVYNVGSERAIPIAELARLVSEGAQGHPEVRIAGTPDPSRPPDRYVPSTARARESLGLQEWISLEDSIARTLGFLREAHHP